MLPTRDEILAKAATFPPSPVAIEAWWDGDTYGWFVVLAAVYPDPGGERQPYREVDISTLQGDGGDMRLFNGIAPPGPEAALLLDRAVRQYQANQQLDLIVSAPAATGPESPEARVAEAVDFPQRSAPMVQRKKRAAGGDASSVACAHPCAHCPGTSTLLQEPPRAPSAGQTSLRTFTS